MDPLSRWGPSIEELTNMKKDKQVTKAYRALLCQLNSKEFEGKLVDQQNATLIVPPRPISSRTTHHNDEILTNQKQKDSDWTPNQKEMEACSRNIELLVTEQTSLSVVDQTNPEDLDERRAISLKYLTLADNSGREEVADEYGMTSSRF